MSTNDVPFMLDIGNHIFTSIYSLISNCNISAKGNLMKLNKTHSEDEDNNVRLKHFCAEIYGE